MWKESGILFCKSLCKLFLPTDILTSTNSKAGRHPVRFLDCFLSQFWAFVPLWCVVLLGELEEAQPHAAGCTSITRSTAWTTAWLHRLSDLSVNFIFLSVDQFHCFHSSPVRTGHSSKLCSFFLPPLLPHAYFHFILELSYFFYKSLHLPADIRIAWGWRFSKDTIWQVFSLNEVPCHILMPIQLHSVHLTDTCFHKILSSILYFLRSHTFLILAEVLGLEEDGLFKEKQPKINLEECNRRPHFRSIFLLCTHKAGFSAEDTAFRLWSLWLPLKQGLPGMRASKHISHTWPSSRLREGTLCHLLSPAQQRHAGHFQQAEMLAWNREW